MIFSVALPPLAGGVHTMVVVAQLVELQFVVLAVAGSSPVDHPILFSWYEIARREDGLHLPESFLT